MLFFPGGRSIKESKAEKHAVKLNQQGRKKQARAQARNEWSDSLWGPLLMYDACGCVALFLQFFCPVLSRASPTSDPERTLWSLRLPMESNTTQLRFVWILQYGIKQLELRFLDHGRKRDAACALQNRCIANAGKIRVRYLQNFPYAIAVKAIQTLQILSPEPA